MPEEMEIMDHLLADIQSGIYDPGDKLPSENELADLFRVPRMTVRKAFERLQELGYIYSKQGKGRFVKDRHQRIPLMMSGNKSFSNKMIELGYNYQSKNILCKAIEYNHKIYQALGAHEQERVFKIVRLRIIDHVPIAMHISYVAESMFPEIERIGKDITSMYEFYISKGYDPVSESQMLLSVTFPSKFEREILACSGFIPLLVMEAACKDQTTQKKIDYSKILYRSDYFTYVF
ncbi:GntR family transcriptional regulator [Ectobacillus polymachus]|uniref:GntR family transcriptional regulator n=1 Tax=Ectobacillus polymachus TaxID=1508806 RepID=UPI003A837438